MQVKLARACPYFRPILPKIILHPIFLLCRSKNLEIHGGFSALPWYKIRPKKVIKGALAGFSFLWYRILAKAI